MQRSTVLFVLCFMIALALPLSAAPVDGPTAFEQLKSLGGTWRGGTSAVGAAAEAEAAATPEVVHEFEVSAGGTVVMETMGPDTPGEMINMYYLDGDDLVLTHYCAGGNQPTMKLNVAESTDETLVFDFTGGTNLEHASEHIHSAEITIKNDGEVDSVWHAYSGDELAGTMRFHLVREN